MSAVREMIRMLEEIQEKQQHLEDMSQAWEGDDPCEAAVCDPSDQFCLGEEIENDLQEFKRFVIENIED